MVTGITIGPGFWGSFMLGALAVWRITHLLASEDGPGDLVFHLRTKLGSSFAGKLMDCFYCLSLWVAGPFAFLVTRQIWGWMLTWFALSAAACLLERITAERAGTQPSERETPYALLRQEEKRLEDQFLSQHKQ